MAGIPFVAPIDNLRYAEVDVVAPNIRRVIARNPSKFTFTGTGTYIIGSAHDRAVAVIDPGPDLPEHRDALLAAIGGVRVGAIVITHCHSDHIGLAAWLKSETGAPLVAWKPHGSTGELDNADDLKVMDELKPPPKTAEEIEKDREIARQAGLDPDDMEQRETTVVLQPMMWSPVNNAFSSSRYTHKWFDVCPGVCTAVSDQSSIVKNFSPSATRTVGSKS